MPSCMYFRLQHITNYTSKKVLHAIKHYTSVKKANCAIVWCYCVLAGLQKFSTKNSDLKLHNEPLSSA